MLGNKSLMRDIVVRVYKMDSINYESLQKVPHALKLGSCFVPWSESKEKRILNEGIKKVEKNLEIGNFLIKFLMLWGKLKKDMTPLQKFNARNGEIFLLSKRTRVKKPPQEVSVA